MTDGCNRVFLYHFGISRMDFYGQEQKAKEEASFDDKCCGCVMPHFRGTLCVQGQLGTRHADEANAESFCELVSAS